MDSYQRQMKHDLRELRKTYPNITSESVTSKYSINLPIPLMQRYKLHTRKGTKYGGSMATMVIEAMEAYVNKIEGIRMVFDRPATRQELEQWDLIERRQEEALLDAKKQPRNYYFESNPIIARYIRKRLDNR